MWNRDETDNIIGHKDGDDGWKYYRKSSRLAINAVLEHFSNAANITQEMLDAADYELCSDDSFVTKEVIAAALRKAAGK
jgi:hypothetical protein